MGEASGKTPVSKVQQPSVNTTSLLCDPRYPTLREGKPQTGSSFGRGRACLSWGAPSRLRNLPSPWPREESVIQGGVELSLVLLRCP